MAHHTILEPSAFKIVANARKIVMIIILRAQNIMVKTSF